MQYIFIHGLGQDPSGWDETKLYLGGQRRIDCPDLSLFLKDEDVSYGNLYGAFSEYCGDISGPVHLCGLSLGAVIALNYAVDHSEKVRSLVLIAPQYKMPKILLKLQNMIFRFLPERSFAGTGIGKEKMRKLTNSMGNLDFSGNLEKISCPALILCGERDTANRKAAGIMAERIRGAEIRTIKNAGHEVNKEAPEQLAEGLRDFYTRLK